MIITTERLHYLWAVAEAGSFSAAGERLGVTGAAVQQVIRQMEDDLDAALFHRGAGRRPELTELGRQFYFHALDIIPRLEGLERLASLCRQGQEEVLHIGVHAFVMTPEVMDVLTQLQRQFPLLELFLYDAEDCVLHCDKLRLLDKSARHTVDVLLAPARMRYDHGGQSITAGRIVWRVAAAVGHPLSRLRGEVSLDDLLQYPQLLPMPGVISSDAFYESFRLSSRLIHYSQFYQLQEMLLAGMGFAVMPEQIALPLVRQGRLRLLDLDFDDGASSTAVELAWVSPLGAAGEWLVERLRSAAPGSDAVFSRKAGSSLTSLF